MKITGLLLLVALVQVSASTYSQSTKLTLNLKNVMLSEVFKEIEKTSEFRFFYDSQEIDPSTEVSIKTKDTNIKDILDDVFNNSDVSYKIIDRYVVLNKKGTEIDFPTVQQNSISGTVTDDAGEPLPGVTIVVKGTTQGVVSDIDGNFSLEDISSDATLVFSFVGMKTQEVSVDGKSSLSIILEADAIGLEEVIAVGYGTMKKSDLTGSVQRVDAAQYAAQSTTNMLEILNGTVAGFTSNQGTSAKGGGSMQIRGENSLSTSSNPLVVLDGVIYEGNIDDINPSDIESLDLLKDASSAAIFGSKSASGVIIITTKHGRRSKPTIRVTSKLGITGLTNEMKPLGPDKYISNRADYLRREDPTKPYHYFTNPNTLPSDISIDEWRNYDVATSDDAMETYTSRLLLQPIEAENFLKGRTFDWYDAAMQNGLRQDYNVSLSGGTENLRYFWSLGYTDNEGVMTGDKYETVRSRVNIDTDVTDFLNVGINAQYADKNQGFTPVNLNDVLRNSPYGEKYDENGDLTWYPHDDFMAPNPFVSNEQYSLLHKTQSLFATLFAELKLPYGFSYRVAFANSYEWNKRYQYIPSDTPAGSLSGGYGKRQDNSSYKWSVDNIFKWKKTIAEIHDFDVTFLVNADKKQWWNGYMENTQFQVSEALTYHNLQLGGAGVLFNNDAVSTGRAMMGRINYALKDRYMITASIRRDGFSAFGQKHPYATFPSVALGWRISEEDFFDVSWIDHLKLRGSWGENGNSSIGIYSALAELGTMKYIYGVNESSGVFYKTMANEDLKWEATEALNLGLDFGLFDSRVSGSVEAYYGKTKNLLLQQSLPKIMGFEWVMANLGEIKNSGFELTLNTRNVNKANIKWNSDLIFSFNRNEIVHLYGEMEDVLDESGNVIGQKEMDDVSNRWFIGQALDRIWDYETMGTWKVGQEEEAAVYGQAPGDMRLKDVNDDGVVNFDDKVFQGYRNPRYNIGFKNTVTIFKNIDLYAFIRADLGHYGVNNLHLNKLNNAFYERTNYMETPYWTPDNQLDDYARLKSEALGANYYEKRSFVRLQDISASYSFPKALIERYQIENLKVSLSLRNPLTITGWNHWDPESGTNPMPKYFTFGVDVTL